jgi:solute:Na+ symporter, SSS family
MSDSLRWLLGVTIGVYVVGIFALSVLAQRRIDDAEDFIVAGRRLPLSLSWATLLATWFGAGTLLTVADEVRREGLVRAALDPFGAGLCLIVAGLFFARPLWRMGLLTVADFFRRRFGPRAELLSALIMVPSYFGWIAAQFVALAAMLDLFFGLPLVWGLPIVALVGAGYTWMGGMWSVTLTDAVQIVLVLAGLVVLTWNVTSTLGGGGVAAGWARFVAETPHELLVPWPRGRGVEFVGWLSVLLVGALGNIPGQDLLQRVFAARSERVARHACFLAGAAYLTFGCLPIFLALASRILLPETAGRSILPALAGLFLTPGMAVVFTLALMSAVLSTIDSALLSPATVLAQNVLPRLRACAAMPSLALNRLAVAGVAVCSLALAYVGESAYSLLESAYELTLVGLFVPLTLGLLRTPRREASGLAAMVAGCGAWLLHAMLDWDSFLAPWLGDSMPAALGATALSLLAYLVVDAAPSRGASTAG